MDYQGRPPRKCQLGTEPLGEKEELRGGGGGCACGGEAGGEERLSRGKILRIGLFQEVREEMCAGK